MNSGSDKTMKNPKKNISKLQSITGSVGLLVMLMIYTAIGGLVREKLIYYCKHKCPFFFLSSH